MSAEIFIFMAKIPEKNLKYHSKTEFYSDAISGKTQAKTKPPPIQAFTPCPRLSSHFDQSKKLSDNSPPIGDQRYFSHKIAIKKPT